MNNILRKIEEQKKRTGLRIIDNPYTLGANVIDSSGKSIYSGSNLACQLFVNNYERKILNETKTATSEVCPHCGSTNVVKGSTFNWCNDCGLDHEQTEP